MKKLSFAFSLSVVFLLLSCNKKATNIDEKNDVKAVKVETMVATKHTSEIRLSYSGTIEPSLAVPMSFQIPGTITKINVDEGDYVQKSQILAELNKTSFLGAYNAALAIQQQAQDAYDRLKTVYENGSLAEIKWIEMKSKLEQANSSLQIAKQNLSNCTMTAPSSGIIGSRNIEVGANAIPANTVIQIVTINPVFVKVSVPENEINKIKKGMTATITIPAIGSKIFTGKVTKVGVMANQVSKTYSVKIELPNPDQEIKPGMVCDAELPIKYSTSIVSIPYQSVIEDNDKKTYVYIVDNRTNKVLKQAVELGSFINNQIEVKSGISEGDLVVINGQHKITDNIKIEF